MHAYTRPAKVTLIVTISALSLWVFLRSGSPNTENHWGKKRYTTDKDVGTWMEHGWTDADSRIWTIAHGCRHTIAGTDADMYACNVWAV